MEIDQMQAHVDEGGQLTHSNGIDLLREVGRLQSLFSNMPECQLVFKCKEDMDAWDKWKDTAFNVDGTLKETTNPVDIFLKEGE